MLAPMGRLWACPRGSDPRDGEHMAVVEEVGSGSTSLDQVQEVVARGTGSTWAVRKAMAHQTEVE